MFASGIIVLVLDFLLTVSLAYIASRKLFSMDIKNATIKIVFTAYLLSFFVPSITPVSQTQFGNNFLNNDASKIVMTHTESYVQNENNQAEDPYKAGVLTLELTVKNNLDYPIKLRDVRSESMHCSSSEDVNIYNLTLLAGESHNFALLCNVDNMKAMQEESHKSFSYEPIYTRLFLSLSLDTLANSKSLSNSQPATINFVFEPGLQGEYIKYIEKSIQTKAYNWFK